MVVLLTAAVSVVVVISTKLFNCIFVLESVVLLVVGVIVEL